MIEPPSEKILEKPIIVNEEPSSSSSNQYENAVLGKRKAEFEEPGLMSNQIKVEN